MPGISDRTTFQIPSPSERLSEREQITALTREVNRVLAMYGSVLREITGESGQEPALFNHTSMQDHRLMDLAEPTVDTDAATRGFVESHVAEQLTALRDEDLPDRIARGLLPHPALDDLNASDDHNLLYVAMAIARTITAIHTFAPAAPGVPFILGANALGQLVTGFNADLVDGFSVLTGTATVNVGVIAPLGTATFTISVASAAVGETVCLGPPAGIEADLIWCGFVSSAGVVTVRLSNLGVAGVDPGNATWAATVLHVG